MTYARCNGNAEPAAKDARTIAHDVAKKSKRQKINAMEIEVAVQRVVRRPGLPCLLCVVLRGPADDCDSRAPEVALYTAICFDVTAELY